jgi:hypothetical protein
MQNQLSKTNSQNDELNDRLIKNIDLMNTQIEMERKMELMEKKMDENMECMENKRLELKNYMPSMILHDLYERLPKGDIKMKGKHENVEEIKIESQNHDYSSLQNPHH